jgi:hypothetical protein
MQRSQQITSGNDCNQQNGSRFSWSPQSNVNHYASVGISQRFLTCKVYISKLHSNTFDTGRQENAITPRSTQAVALPSSPPADLIQLAASPASYSPAIAALGSPNLSIRDNKICTKRSALSKT